LKPFTVDELLKAVKEVLRTSEGNSGQFAPPPYLAEPAIA
jgi:DNA-binding response OmpR family regulator